MGFRRFLIWIVEKLVELNLGAAVLLLVKFVLPVAPQAYTGVAAFAQGVRDTFAAASDDASFVAGTFMGDSGLTYAGHAWLAAVWVIGFYFYVSSLYVLLSLLALGLARGHYLLNAMVGYLLAFAVFAVRFVHVYDAENLISGAALLVLGAVVVLISAAVGERLSGAPSARPLAAGRMRLDLSH